MAPATSDSSPLIAKTQRQPKAVVIIPATKGPAARPRYTAPMFRPMARPSRSRGTLSVRMAMFVAAIREAAAPCSTRKASIVAAEGSTARARVVAVNRATPRVKRVFLSAASLTRPAGSISAVAVPR